MAIIIQRSGNPLSHFGNVVGQAAMGYAQGLQQHQKAEKERKATEQISTLREMQIEKGEREQTATLAGGTALTAIDAGLGSNVFAITEHKDKPPTVELVPNLRAQLPFMDPQQEELLTEQLTLHTNNMESAWYEERVPDVIAQLNRVAGVGTDYETMQVPMPEGPALQLHGAGGAIEQLVNKGGQTQQEIYQGLRDLLGRAKAERQFQLNKTSTVAYLDTLVGQLPAGAAAPEGVNTDADSLAGYMMELKDEALSALSTGDGGKPGFWDVINAKAKFAAQTDVLTPREMEMLVTDRLATRESEIVEKVAEAFGVPVPEDGNYETLDKDLEDKGLLPGRTGGQVGGWSIEDIDHAIGTAQTPEAAANLQKFRDDLVAPFVAILAIEEDSEEFEAGAYEGEDIQRFKERMMSREMAQRGITETPKLIDAIAQANMLRIKTASSAQEPMRVEGRKDAARVRGEVMRASGGGLLGGGDDMAGPMVSVEEALGLPPKKEPDPRARHKTDDTRPGPEAGVSHDILAREALERHRGEREEDARKSAALAKERQYEEMAGGKEPRAKQVAQERIKLDTFFKRNTTNNIVRMLIPKATDERWKPTMSRSAYKELFENTRRKVARIKAAYKGGDDIDAHHQAMELMQRAGA